jgi:hypothetical protein
MLYRLVMASISRTLSARVRERETLARALSAPQSEFLAIYGRRRVGKTFLVRRFFQDHPVIYFEMVGLYQGSLDDHLRIFSEALSATFHEGARLSPPPSWHEAFRSLEETIGRYRKGKKKFVIFFDELPWIATHRSAFLGELEHFWNAWCSRRDDIVLIVCGSAASWMLQKIVQARGGLHNRLTRTIRLSPFTLGETRSFLRDRKLDFTDDQIVELYMVFGGVPHYLDQVERGRSVPQIVDAVCLDAHGPLADEFARLFASLFGADDAHESVVRALAKRRSGLGRTELLAAVGLPSGGGATTVLESLEEGGFIGSTIPFGRTSRDRFFRLTDEFTQFHFQWLTGRRPKSWQQIRGTPRWQVWAGLSFESLCLRHVDAIERALGISGVRTEASAWRHKEAQIDLIIDRADGVISVCEVKFTDAPFRVTKSYAEQLKRKIAVFREHTGATKAIHRVFVTSRGLSPGRYADESADAVVTMGSLFV